MLGPPHPGVVLGLLLGGEDINTLPRAGGSKDAPPSRQSTLLQRHPLTLTRRRSESQEAILRPSGTSFKPKGTLLSMMSIVWIQPSTVQQR